MNKKLFASRIVLIFAFLFAMFIFTNPAYADLLHLNEDEEHNVIESTEFLFEDSKEVVKQLMLANTSSINFTFSFFKDGGGNISIAPLVNFKQIGNPQLVPGTFETKTVTLDFGTNLTEGDSIGISVLPSQSFARFFLLPEISLGNIITIGSSSGGGSSQSSSGSSGSTATPNSFVVIGKFLPDDLIKTFYNEDENKKCQMSSCGIDPESIEKLNPNDLFNSLSSGSSNRTVNLKFRSEEKSKSKTVFKQEFANSTDMTQIFLTTIYPSFIENIDSSSSTSRATSNVKNILKNQNVRVPSLTGFEHLISSRKHWKTSANQGFYSGDNSTCLNPVFANIVGDMIVVLNKSTCTPAKLTNSKASFSIPLPITYSDPYSLSNIFKQALSIITTPFASLFSNLGVNLTSSSNLIYTNATNNSTSPSSVNIQNGILIFQPIDPIKSRQKFIETIKLVLSEEDKNPFCGKSTITEEACTCSETIGRCCEKDEEGRVISLCKQVDQNNTRVCRCLPYVPGDPGPD